MRFLSGCTMTALLITQPEWWAIGILVVGIATFWKPLARLTDQVLQDREMKRIRKALAYGPHVDAGAREAWEYFHG